ncbi:MAG: hypothetical protein Kow00109_18210 [Acidobacteriota bacterium]
MYKDHRITVVIPCLNEAEGLREVLSSMPSFVDEVIVVDNNSTDHTAEVAAGFGAKVIREEVRGYGRAYKTGLLHARGDIIITLDGDQSYPVDALSYLIEALLHSRVGFISASRFPISDPETMSRMHRWGNRLLSLATSLLFFRWVWDSQSGMWIFYRDVLRKMELVSDGMAFSEEIKLEAMLNPEIGFREIPIRFSNRAGEKKLRPWRDGWQNLMFLLRKRLQTLFRSRSRRRS